MEQVYWLHVVLIIFLELWVPDRIYKFKMWTNHTGGEVLHYCNI